MVLLRVRAWPLCHHCAGHIHVPCKTESCTVLINELALLRFALLWTCAAVPTEQLSSQVTQLRQSRKLAHHKFAAAMLLVQ